MIEEYHFSSITIDNKTYNNDVEVRSLGSKTEVLDWQGEEANLIGLFHLTC